MVICNALLRKKSLVTLLLAILADCRKRTDLQDINIHLQRCDVACRSVICAARTVMTLLMSCDQCQHWAVRCLSLTVTERLIQRAWMGHLQSTSTPLGRGGVRRGGVRRGGVRRGGLPDSAAEGSVSRGGPPRTVRGAQRGHRGPLLTELLLLAS